MSVTMRPLGSSFSVCGCRGRRGAPKPPFCSLFLRMICLYKPNYSSPFNFTSFPFLETKGKHRRLLK